MTAGGVLSLSRLGPRHRQYDYCHQALDRQFGLFWAGLAIPMTKANALQDGGACSIRVLPQLSLKSGQSSLFHSIQKVRDHLVTLVLPKLVLIASPSVGLEAMESP